MTDASLVLKQTKHSNKSRCHSDEVMTEQFGRVSSERSLYKMSKNLIPVGIFFLPIEVHPKYLWHSIYNSTPSTPKCILYQQLLKKKIVNVLKKCNPLPVKYKPKIKKNVIFTFSCDTIDPDIDFVKYTNEPVVMSIIN